MSDSISETGNSRPNRTVRTLLLLNGVAGGVLVLGLVLLAPPWSRTDNSADKVEIQDPPPIAQGRDTAEDEDDDNGRPKEFKLNLSWNPGGIADFEFTERSGRTIQKADLAGHPWVVGFIFTNCAGPCFKVSSAMSQLENEFKDTDLRLVTLTVDPERDTPEVLTKYANTFKADPDKWLFLTGEKTKLYQLIWGSFLMPVQEETGERRQPGFEFIHTTNVLLVDEHGVVQGKWASTDEAEFDQLRRTLRKRLRKSDEPDSPAAADAAKDSP